MAETPTIGKIGLGLLAGLAGTLAMTLSQKIEMALTERPASKVPAEAAEKITGVEVEGPAEDRLATAMHLAFGTGLGAGLALLDRVGEPGRTLAFFAGAQGAGMATLQGLGLEGKPTEWTPGQAAIETVHHAVYAIAASLAYRGAEALLQRRAD